MKNREEQRTANISIKLKNILSKYQKYLLGIALVLSSIAISIRSNDGKINLVLHNYPALIFLMVVVSSSLVAIYFHFNTRKISRLSSQIKEHSKITSEGMLYFFFNLDSGDDGKVIFSKDVDELERAIPPKEFKEEKKSFLKRLLTGKPQKRILKESRVEIYKAYAFPSWDSLRLERIQKITRTAIKPIK